MHPLEHSRTWLGDTRSQSGRIPTFAPDTKSGTVTQIYRSEGWESILSPGTKARLEAGEEIRVQTDFDFAFHEQHN